MEFITIKFSPPDITNLEFYEAAERHYVLVG